VVRHSKAGMNYVLHIRVGVASLAFLAACGGAARTPVPTGVPVIAVMMPRGEDGDQASTLTNGEVGHDDWYCAEAPAPQRYELMLADGLAQRIAAIGFVPGNIGPDGVGPVEVRVQHGHGVAAHGSTFEARPQGRSGRLEVLVLPTPTNGDHVVLTFRRQSPYAVTRCLGELTVYTDTETYRGHGAAIVHLHRIEQGSDEPASGSEAPMAASGSGAPEGPESESPRE
jgi:hypothetical protein